MAKQPADTDDDIGARIAYMADIALAAAMEAKGTALTDDEADAIFDNCAWWVLALANGLSPQACRCVQSRG